jgi:twitching motility protein PilT
MIREGKVFQIPGAIGTGRRVGMQLMDQALLQLVKAGEVDPDEAFLKAVDRREFVKYVTESSLLNLAEMQSGERAA